MLRIALHQKRNETSFAHITMIARLQPACTKQNIVMQDGKHAHFSANGLRIHSTHSDTGCPNDGISDAPLQAASTAMQNSQTPLLADKTGRLDLTKIIFAEKCIFSVDRGPREHTVPRTTPRFFLVRKDGWSASGRVYPKPSQTGPMTASIGLTCSADALCTRSDSV